MMMGEKIKMRKDYRTYNLSVPGVKQNSFSHPFYSAECEKINFKGVIKEYKIDTNQTIDYISLASKFKPHSDYELMLQSTDSICKSAITSLSDEALYKIFGIGYEFIKFLSDPKIIKKYGMDKGYPYLVSNSDEFTTDRHSGMSKKPFHLHLNSWKAETINKIKPINKNKVSRFYYESVVDPIFDITQTLTRDALEHNEFAKYIKPVDLSCGEQTIEYSSVYEVVDGWNFLQKNDFVHLLKEIHLSLEKRYIEILKCFTGKETIPELYTRHQLLSKSEIIDNLTFSDMQDLTIKALIELVDRITSISPEQFKKISKKTNFRDTLISLRWLAYSIAFFSNDYINHDMPLTEKPLYMNVTPRLFTKIGGASIMNFPENSHVKIDRGEGHINQEEFDERLDFHQEFTKRLK